MTFALESAPRGPAAGPRAPAGRPRWRSPALFCGAAILAALSLLALVAPWLAPYDPNEQLDPAAGLYRRPGTELWVVRLADGRIRLADRVERTPAGLTLRRLGRDESHAADQVTNLTATGVAETRYYLLGSDKFGRDLASRTLYGARISLGVAGLAVLFALTLGVAVGAAAALGGPLLDNLLMRSLDALLAFPWLFLMVTVSALFKPGPSALVVILGVSSWMTISRLTRAELLGLRQRDFITAAVAMGQGPWRILGRHLLPNAMTPVMIQATLLFGNLILAESALSFLGMGVQPPHATWGNLVAEGREALLRAWWISSFPGGAIALAVIGFNLLGEGLRDALDPRSRR